MQDAQFDNHLTGVKEESFYWLTKTIGPFIREKIRRELDHLYEHVLFKTETARINGSRLISVLDSFSCKCCP